MGTFLDKKYFFCPNCGSDRMEIEVDIESKGWDNYELRIELTCLDCELVPGKAYNWSLEEFDNILKQKQFGM